MTPHLIESTQTVSAPMDCLQPTHHTVVQAPHGDRITKRASQSHHPPSPTTELRPRVELPTIHHMDNGWPRTILTALCVITCALLGLLASQFVVGLRGVAAPAIIDASSPRMAAIAVMLCFGGAVALACLLSRPINAVVSLFAIGCGVATFTMRCGNISDAVFQATHFRLLGAETLFWSWFVAFAAIVAFRIGGALPDVPSPDPEQPYLQSLFRKKSLLMLLAALLAPAILTCTLVGASKGQSVGACTLVGIATALVARLIAPREQPILIFAAPIVVIGITQLFLASAAVSTVQTLQTTFAAGLLNPILCAMPADVAAGALCGVAIGLGWSKGLVKPTLN